HVTPLQPTPLLPFPLMPPRPPSSTLFPYTTLFRSSSGSAIRAAAARARASVAAAAAPSPATDCARASASSADGTSQSSATPASVDRKSTRLNSSHSQISYAVFCLKKKTNTRSSWRDHVNLTQYQAFPCLRHRALTPITPGPSPAYNICPTTANLPDQLYSLDTFDL